MANRRHHSGYLADDEARHFTYVARVQSPKKPLFREMGPTSKLGREPHLPSMYGSSALRCHRQNKTGPEPFGSFLDFLTEGQVLESLQTVVEEATERMTAVKTEAGVPLVEVQDPVEMPSDRRRVHARPSLRTVHRHRARPSLCTGRPNNYPSCSSSTSDSHSSLKAGQLGSHSWDSDLRARGLSSLPPVTDELLLEKNLKRLLRLENKGKGLSQSCSQKDSLLWDSVGSQTGSQRSQEQPLSWFSGLLDSSSGTPESSDLGPGERELMFLKQEFNKEIKSLLNQPASSDLPGYYSLREPHRTLDFLAEHHLFPVLQGVVSQAVDKLSGARRRDGCPLFPANFESTSGLPVNFDLLLPGSKFTTSDREEPCDSLPTTDSSSRMFCRKINSRQDSPSTSSAQMATKFRLKNPGSKFSKKQPLPPISSKPSTSHFGNPCYEELNFLTQQAVSLLIRKYKFENNLNKQLGFISFPVTEMLMDLNLGFKNVKGSHIHLSSNINRTCLRHKLEKAERAWHASQRSPESPSTLPPPPTNTNQDQLQATEPCHTHFADLSAGQLLSSQKPVTAEDQTLRSPLEPKLSVYFGTGVGSSPPKSKETPTGKDSEYSDRVEVDDEASASKDDSESQSPPQPGVEALVSHSVDVGHSDPP
ncbi:PREDICTED: coiled-coil domain-containing protein 116 [Propithecus coquereli]|uniref:coiled-coil domain-containing protein 116 n=1 Tax=Propithecus coquereli TaxID=379532 RepID=UPI00063F42FC|nr:PREDICTED: coiled-coil domain-containing protein 116 [Propithecus coquereli]